MNHRDEHEVEAERNRYLRECRSCGCRGNGLCRRLIDIRDGSVWPAQDTGFRVGQETKKYAPKSWQPPLGAVTKAQGATKGATQ